MDNITMIDAQSTCLENFINYTSNRHYIKISFSVNSDALYMFRKFGVIFPPQKKFILIGDSKKISSRYNLNTNHTLVPKATTSNASVRR